jgi:hypothetical protein
VIGDLRLDKLTPARVQRLVTETRNSQTSRGTAPSAATLRHVYKLIRNALGDAHRMELVTRNVATLVKAPPLARDRRPMPVLGHAEIGGTMNTYAHVLPELRQEAADAIDDLFGT